MRKYTYSLALAICVVLTKPRIYPNLCCISNRNQFSLFLTYLKRCSAYVWFCIFCGVFQQKKIILFLEFNSISRNDFNHHQYNYSLPEIFFIFLYVKTTMWMISLAKTIYQSKYNWKASSTSYIFTSFLLFVFFFVLFYA